MGKRIAIIQGHPDDQSTHYGHALAQAYAESAAAAGHTVKMIEVAHLDFPLLRNKADFEHAAPPAAIAAAQSIITWAEHLLIIYPLWLGTMPALLKAFFEQLFRPDFTFSDQASGKRWYKKLKGRSARIVVTMGMPAFFYRWYFHAHGLKNLERNILRFCGIRPLRSCLIGMVEDKTGRKRQKWLRKLSCLGRQAR